MIGKTDILLRICFRLGWLCGLAILPLSAGGLESSPSPAVTSVVRTDHRSGKLVRVVAGSRRPGAILSSTVNQIAAEQALPPELIDSVIQVESDYNPYAISPKGARGIMQLIPETARRFGVSNPFDVSQNINGGARYLKYLLNLYKGDTRLALAAYNAGEQAVARYGGVPPYPETRSYVEDVGKRLERTMAAKPKQTAASPPASLQTDPDAPRHIQQIVEPDGAVRYVSR
ncbi:MAG: lytic transglycosylase domain-containing protein [Acidobacteriia bacterium]|nr:lytic transglycosylase domain-containing protein [Terriglobia bacterium]